MSFHSHSRMTFDISGFLLSQEARMTWSEWRDLHLGNSTQSGQVESNAVHWCFIWQLDTPLRITLASTGKHIIAHFPQLRMVAKRIERYVTPEAEFWGLVDRELAFKPFLPNSGSWCSHRPDIYIGHWAHGVVIFESFWLFWSIEVDQRLSGFVGNLRLQSSRRQPRTGQNDDPCKPACDLAICGCFGHCLCIDKPQSWRLPCE